MVILRPGEDNWKMFRMLVEEIDPKGNLMKTATLAAVAIENHCRLASFERDFALFTGLQWIEPKV